MTTEDFKLVKTLLEESGGPNFKKLSPIDEPPNVRDRLKDGENLIDLYNELYAYCNHMTQGMDANESYDFTNEAEANFWQAAEEVLIDK